MFSISNKSPSDANTAGRSGPHLEDRCSTGSSAAPYRDRQALNLKDNGEGSRM